MSGKKQRNFDWLIWLWFVFLAIFFTRPLILKMENEVAGEIGDNIYFIWMIGWVKKALFTLGVDPLNVWFLNYPEGWNIPFKAKLILRDKSKWVDVNNIKKG